MKKIIMVGIFVLAVAGACFAQSDEKKSLTVTTYYPAPYAVYSSLQLSSLNDASTLTNSTGTIFFNSTDQKPYVNIGGNWTPLAGSMPFTYNIASPSICLGTKSNDTRNKDQLCSVPWQEVVVFPRRFSSIPHVIVIPVEIPYDVNSSCANNSTDQYISYPKDITTTNFTMVAAGSVGSNHYGEIRCENASEPHKYDNWYTRALVTWFAITE